MIVLIFLGRCKMKWISFKGILFGTALAFLFSCVTINIYFPEATVKKTADEIVEEVRKSEGKEKEKKDISSQSSSFSLVSSAYAQQETEVSTPAIRALKESLKQRFPAIEPFFEKGAIGEANDGFIQIRDESALSLKEKADLRNLVKNENADRKNLYAEVGSALNIDPSQIPRIQKIFAESWIKNARPGWWIQEENGQWKKKS